MQHPKLRRAHQHMPPHGSRDNVRLHRRDTPGERLSRLSLSRTRAFGAHGTAPILRSRVDSKNLDTRSADKWVWTGELRCLVEVCCSVSSHSVRKVRPLVHWVNSTRVLFIRTDRCGRCNAGETTRMGSWGTGPPTIARSLSSLGHHDSGERCTWYRPLVRGAHGRHAKVFGLERS